ncbi:TPA: alanine--tRNA ligase [Candidatus Taylorbacteria bacterium]|nr:alanine--tRNA ligase [Candidatus Taylorbacteria bacterium]
MQLSSDQIRSRYLEFFKKRGHAIIPSAPLVPENDPTTLFNTAGMQPLVPFLLGVKHPQGERIVDCQKCVRTGDIDDIGDNRHLTFFEMLGNWSLGDYFKNEAINWSFEFLTSKKEELGEQGLGLDPKRLYVTVFKGEDGIPRDNESIEIWKKVLTDAGLKAEVASDDEVVKDDVRIIPLGVNDNFWIAGATGPCGGDTEMFYDTRPEEGKLEGKFGDLVDSFRLIEVWNDVFMEFNKTTEGKYQVLAKKNVDTGMGLERTTVVVNGKQNVFETDCFEPILNKIKSAAKSTNEKSERIVADHMRTATFMIADGVVPSNTDRGYILRRIIRRAVRHADVLGLSETTLSDLINIVVQKFESIYPNLAEKQDQIKEELQKEEKKFRETLSRGMKEFEKLSSTNISGTDAFTLFSSYGFPLEVILELAKEKVISVDVGSFDHEMKKHQELSRASAEKKFKGGLGDTSEKSVQYHTATHLLNAALRQVLGTHVMQKGSNITPERLRFDFSHGEKMTDEQKKQVESLVNCWIQTKLPVELKELPKIEAEKVAIHSFNEKYADIVKVYSIGTEGNYISREFCGGPHVKNTSELAGNSEQAPQHFKIQKEEAVSAGVRRIKAVLE